MAFSLGVQVQKRIFAEWRKLEEAKEGSWKNWAYRCEAAAGRRVGSLNDAVHLLVAGLIGSTMNVRIDGWVKEEVQVCRCDITRGRAAGMQARLLQEIWRDGLVVAGLQSQCWLECPQLRPSSKP